MRTTSHSFLLVFLVTLMVGLTPQTSQAFFGREKSRLLDAAKETFEAAQQAREERRFLDELSLLTDAKAQFTRLYSRYPKYEPEFVQQHVAKCSLRIVSINARIRSGEIQLPNPDEIVQGAGKGFVSSGVSPETEPTQATAGGMPMPPLVPLEEVVKPAPKESAPRVLQEKPEAVAPVEKTPVAVKPAEKKVAEKASKKKEKAKGAREADVAASEEAEDVDGAQSPMVTEFLKAPDAQRAHILEALLEKEGAAQVMMLLEDVIEQEGEKATELTRSWFVKSLILCRNTPRAKMEMMALKEAYPNSPSTLSLAATAAIQRGDLVEAIFELDQLIKRFPAYSDAYVNLAYAHFMLDPEKNRQMAAVYYESALSYGAKRDAQLEELLNIRIQR